MATFDPPDEGTPNMGMGSSDLQQSIDKNTAAIQSMTTAYQGTSMGNGMKTAPGFSAAAPDARFSSGMFPTMATPMFGGDMAVLGANDETTPAVGGSGSGGQPPTLNATASAAGANGGGPSFGSGTPTAAPGPAVPGSGGAGSTPPTSQPSSGGGSNAGGPSFGAAAGAVGGAIAGLASVGSASMSNMMLYNSTGAQLQNQYGMSAQGAQNSIFGSGVNLGMINGQSPQDMAGAGMTLNQMASGNWGSSQFQQGVAGTNQATAAIQGMSATQGAQFMQSLYSPQTSMNMMTSGFGGVTPLQMGTGKANNMATFTSSILPRLGIQQNGANGTYNKQQVAALSNPGSAQNMDLQNAGWSQSMIQDYSSITGSANNAASSKYAEEHGDNLSSVESLMDTAQGGKTKSQRDQSWSQLQDMGMSRSSLNQVQALTQQQTANQQSESGGFNKTLQQGVGYLADMDEKLGQLLTSFSGLASVLGGAKGAGAVASIGSGMLGGTLGGGIAGGLMGGLGGKLLGSLGSKLLGGGKSLAGEGESLFGDAVGGGESLLGDGAGAIAGGGADAAGGAAAAGGGLAAGLGSGGAALLSMIADAVASKGGSALGNKLGTKGASSHVGGSIGKSVTGSVLTSTASAIPVLGPTIDMFKSMFGFATGGTVPGFTPGTDTHTVRVSGGEGILTPEATMGIGGSATIDFLNTKYAGYRGGGSNESTDGFTTGGTVPKPNGKADPAKGVTQGSAIEQKMLDFMLSQVGKGYSENLNLRLGPTDYDCSGLVYVAAQKAGLPIPKADDVAASEANWLGTYKGTEVIKSQNKVKSGDIIYMTGSAPNPSNYGPIGHAGMALSSSEMVSAYDTAKGVAKTPIGNFVVGFRLDGSGNVTPGGGNGSTPASSHATTTATRGGAPSTTGITAAANGGDDMLGLATDADSALFGGGGGAGGSMPMGSQPTTTTASPTPAGTGSGAPAGGLGPATSGSTTANGKTIFNYLTTNLFGGSKIGAAGALASMYGESNWNPESHEPSSAGDGANNGGLMGFTPLYNYMGHISSSRSDVPDSVVTGNADSDMSHQLKAIGEYLHAFGMMGVVSQMKGAKSVADAANDWGTDVEHYGIDDVHSAGITLATQIAGLATGGTFIAGERGPEAITISNGQSANVMTAAQTHSMLSGTSAMPAQAPWMTSPAAQLLLDMTPANQGHGRGSGGISIAVGGITIGGSTGQFSGTLNSGSDINTIRQQVQESVEEAISQSRLLSAVRSGDTG